MGAAPVRNGVEVGRQRRVAEELRLLVLGARREGEGVVGDGAAAEEEDAVADVAAELGIPGGGGGRVGDGAEGAGGGGGWGLGAAEEGLQRAPEVVESEHLGIMLCFLQSFKLFYEFECGRGLKGGIDQEIFVGLILGSASNHLGVGKEEKEHIS